MVQSCGSWTSRRVCSFVRNLRTLLEGCSEISGFEMSQVDGREGGVVNAKVAGDVRDQERFNK